MALTATNPPMDKLFLNRYGQCFSGGRNVPLGEVCGSVELFQTTKGSAAACAPSLRRHWGCARLHAQGSPCSAMAGAGESTFSREPSSQSEIHVTRKKNKTERIWRKVYKKIKVSGLLKGTFHPCWTRVEFMDTYNAQNSWQKDHIMMAHCEIYIPEFSKTLKWLF